MNVYKGFVILAMVGLIVVNGCTTAEPKNDLSATPGKECPVKIDSSMARTDSMEGKQDTLLSAAMINAAVLKLTKREHLPVKGIYVTGPIAGHRRFKELLRLVEKTELNAMVIDVKNDNGEVTYRMDCSMVEQFGVVTRYIRDVRSLLDTLHKKNIYVIGRVVTFRDPLLAKKKPEWCVHRKNGDIYYDRSGLAWVNPYNREVWKYLANVGVTAAFDGFDEIQYDYIRFSTEVKNGEVDYGFDSDSISKQKIITEFVKYSASRMNAHNIEFSADVFGTVIDSPKDSRDVGQDYVAMGENLSTLSPMIYPSHYAKMVYRLDNPNNHPYEAILCALRASKQALDTLDVECRPNVRPWLQDFSATWISGARSYSAEDVRAQIRAVYDAGYEEWLLWNASNRYREAALKPKHGQADAAEVKTDVENEHTGGADSTLVAE
ncbi:MAG: putative glycoside hydrolase [Paludibacteraceae bacterium]|nr:putative glycoside hydrolase [Prevotellaceae bacterium]